MEVIGEWVVEPLDDCIVFRMPTPRSSIVVVSRNDWEECVHWSEERRRRCQRDDASASTETGGSVKVETIIVVARVSTDLVLSS